MFGRNHFESKPQGASREVVRPTNTDSEALQRLNQEVLETVKKDQDLYALLTPEDIALVTNSLAVQQEKAGAAFTGDMLDNEHEKEGLDGEIITIARARLAARGNGASGSAHV